MSIIFYSREGAFNLLRDFEGVSEWIIACTEILPEHVEILAKHEVLRTCEGVGKILLRKPFEIISMVEPMSITPKRHPHSLNGDRKKNSLDIKPKKIDHKYFCVHHFSDSQNETLLPPEMFVPNQQVIRKKIKYISWQINN